MAPSGRSSRSLALSALALVLATGGLLLWSPWSGAAAVASASEDAPATQEEPEQGRLEGGGAEEAPADEAVARTESAPDEGFAPGIDPAAFPEGPGEEPVRVAVHLSTVEDEKGHPPEDCAGWTVVAQSWIRETEEVFHHESPVNERGVAVFVFPGDVHVDWVRCAPPATSGFGVAYQEDHVDVGAGGSHEWILTMQPGGAATGRVVDLDGAPIAGAEVHAFGGNTYSLGNWTNGLIATASDGDGRFEFPNLSPGRWTFAVAPEQWVQLEPRLGHGAVGVEAGERADAGALRVTTLGMGRLRVLDAEGDGVPGVQVEVRPIEFDDRRLRAKSGGPLAQDPSRSVLGGLRNDYRDFLEGAAPSELGASAGLRAREASAAGSSDGEGATWPYGGFTVTTDGEGIALLRGAPGTWHVEVENPRGLEGDRLVEPFELRLPTGTQVVTLPQALRPFTGRFLTEGGKPVSGIYARLRFTLNGREQTVYAQSDGAGVFRFDGVPPASRYVLESHSVSGSSGYVPQRWELAGARLRTEQPEDFVLPDDAPMLVQVRNERDRAMAGVRFELLDWRGEDGTHASAPGEDLWWSQAQERVRRLRTNGDGDATLRGVRAGVLRVRLTAISGTGRWHPNGRPVTEWADLGEHDVPVGEGRHEIVVHTAHLLPAEARTGTLEGTVRDARSGEPIGGAMVRFSAEGYSTTSRTRSNGHFVVRGGAGEGALSVHAEGYRALRTHARIVEDRETTMDPRLAPGATAICLRFRDREGAALPPLQVRVFGVDGLPLAVREHGRGLRLRSAFGVGADGLLRLVDVPAGALRLRVSCWNQELGALEMRGIELRGPVTGVEDLPPPEEVRLDLTVDEIREALREREQG